LTKKATRENFVVMCEITIQVDCPHYFSSKMVKKAMAAKTFSARAVANSLSMRTCIGEQTLSKNVWP
jgi:hypothetical protein